MLQVARLSRAEKEYSRVHFAQEKTRKASLLPKASQKAKIIAASEGFAIASTTSWCQSQLSAEASHCK
ncbi:hypothetical protein DS67_04565 [Mesotoga sp. SC_4PWA21]|nr:hypothetical protein DS67_04565 [Mesotoga sp. SC_4PWA21]